MRTALYSLMTGIACGAIFQALGLPLPAPPELAGVMGILGIFLGGYIVSTLR